MNTLTLMGMASMVFVAGFTYYTAFVQAHTAGQSPRSAIIEAWFNLVIGFTINFVANMVIVPLAINGGHLDAASNFWMGWVFTTISIVRQYAIRRWFNQHLHAVAARLGAKPD